MKKVITILLITICITAGCGREKLSSSSGEISGSEICGTEDEIISLDKSLIDGMNALSNIDNSLDPYSRTCLTNVACPTPENMVCSILKSYPLESGTLLTYWVRNPADLSTSYHELILLDNDGHQTIISSENSNLSHDYVYGTVLGSDAFLVGPKTQPSTEPNVIMLKKVDTKLNILDEINIDLTQLKEKVNFISQAYMDICGNIHCLAYDFYAGEIIYNFEYCIFSNNGELLYEYHNKNNERTYSLCQTYDGKIGAKLFHKQSGDNSELTSFMYVDPENGNIDESPQVPWYDSKNPRDLWSDNPIKTEDGQMLFGANSGIYKINLETGEKTLLYKFSAHGIRCEYVRSVSLYGEDICVVYSNSDEVNYLWITPTKKEVKISTINIATTHNNASKLNEAAIIFNKKYPAFHIEIEEDPDETRFLTKLIAGEGPALIDASLVGFQEQEKLWQPLGDLIDQLGMTAELIPQVMEYGSINGKLYGIPFDFFMDTMVINDNSISEWDYASFLDYIEAHTDIDAITNNDGYGDDASILLSCFARSMDDNYLFSSDGSTIFHDAEFDRILNDIKSPYNIDNDLKWGDSLVNKKVIYNAVSFTNPRDVPMCRIAFGENINYIGYPNYTGVGHYVYSNNLLCIRKNASFEEKQAALAFINILLTYDCQHEIAKNPLAPFSVRKDVLKEQFMSLTESSVMFTRDGDTRIGHYLDNEADYQMFINLLNNAQGLKILPGSLKQIIYDELNEYYSDIIDRKTLKDRLEKRVTLYLDENK